MTTENEEITNISDENGGETAIAEDRGDNFTPDDGGTPELNPAMLEKLAGEDGEGGESAGKPTGMIPKGRFDEVNNARKLAEQENARLLEELGALRAGKVGEPAEPGTPAPAAAEATPDVAELERQRIDAMMDGDTDKAVEIGNQINALIRKQARAEALDEIDQRNTQATDAQRINEAAESIIGKYPAFDDRSESANEEAIAEMIELRDFYIQKKGMHPAEAIAKAGDKVAQMLGLAAKAEGNGEPDQRTRGAIQRGADVANRQPHGDAVGVGTRQDAGRINIRNMTDEQFDALPEAEKRRLRGD